MKVLNKRHGVAVNKYVKFLLGEAFDMTEDENEKFMEFHKLVKGIIKQSDHYLEGDEMTESEVIHEWLMITPNLLFHSFNGFCVGMGRFDEVCSSSLMKNTFSILKSLSDIATRMKQKEKEPTFLKYVTD